MNIQIIGTRKCSDTRKAERFFSDRSIKYQFRDLAEKNISKGELDNITRKIPIEDLLDREGRQYKKRNMQYMRFNTEEELLADSLLMKTPVVRNGNEATLGYCPEIWKKWLESD